MLRLAALLASLASAGALHAEPPVAQFAGAQLRMAEAELEEARRAFQSLDYRAARRFAAQAALDARLAWAMTESVYLRASAADLIRRAERLRSQGIVSASAGGPSADPR